MGKITEDIKISLNVSLKGSPKGVFPIKKIEITIFILKFAKNTTFYPKIKKIHFRVKSDVWAPRCEKLIEKALFVIKKRTFCYRYPIQIIRCLWGTFEAVLSSQRVRWPYLCVFYSNEG